jgi:hypothetical protein
MKDIVLTVVLLDDEACVLNKPGVRSVAGLARLASNAGTTRS